MTDEPSQKRGRRIGYRPPNDTYKPQRVQPFMRTPSFEAVNDAGNRLEAEKGDDGSAVGDAENLQERPGSTTQGTDGPQQAFGGSNRPRASRGFEPVSSEQPYGSPQWEDDIELKALKNALNPKPLSNQDEPDRSSADALADSPQRVTKLPGPVKPLLRTLSVEAMADAAARLEEEKDVIGAPVGKGVLDAKAQSRITGTSESPLERSCYAVQPHGDGTATVVLDWYETSEGRDFMMRDVFMRTDIEAARKIVRILNASFAHFVRTEHDPVDEETWSAFTSS